MAVDPNNRYDDKDLVKKLGELRAGPIKIASYQVKDPETGEWSSTQIHFTCDNIVLAVLPESFAKLYYNYIQMNHPEYDPKLTGVENGKVG